MLRIIYEKSKIIIAIISIVATLSISIGLFDFFRVSTFEKPIFTLSQTADDGGSGSYYGLGYLIELHGELQDGGYYIFQYTYSILGIEVANVTRP